MVTTDPAAHLAWTVGEAAPFEVSSIDPVQAVADYRRHVMDTKGAGLDADGRANLAEDLRSPCTEEVAVFQAFAAAVEQSAHRFVVMDTAPTGHTPTHSPQPVQRPARCMACMVWTNSFSFTLSSCVIQCGSRLSDTQ